MSTPRNVSGNASALTAPEQVGILVILVSLEVRSGRTRFMQKVQAESIKQAVSLANTRYPGCEARVLFPIDSGAFFVEESAPAPGAVRLEALEGATR